MKLRRISSRLAILLSVHFFLACSTPKTPFLFIEPSSAAPKKLMGATLPSRPPGKSLKAAVIYFRSEDDNFELGEITRKGWPHQLPAPIWRKKMLIPSRFAPTTYINALQKNPESLTSFFYQMSAGRLWIYGDSYVYDGPPMRKARGKNQREIKQKWRENNTRILQWFADRYNHPAYDNDDDGAVDLIILICRARPDFSYQGIAKLPVNLVHVKKGQPRIVGASGVYQKGCYTFRATRNLIAHEIGHKMGLYHENGLHRFGLMAGVGAKPPKGLSPTMSAFEKHRLGWLEYVEIRKDTQNVRLGNLTVANKAIKIPIENSRDYFVLENRQYSQPFEPPPGEGVFFDKTLSGTGLLVYLVQNNKPYMLPADGRVTTIIIGEKDRQTRYYNGDDSDLFGNGKAPESVTLSYPKTVRRRPGLQTSIAVTNPRREKNEMIFDVIFDSPPLPGSPRLSAMNKTFSVSHAPDPFTWKTRIRYHLPQSTHVRISVFDEKGLLVKKLLDRFQNAWDYEVEIDGYRLSSGRYRYVVEAFGKKREGWVTFKSALE